MQEQKIDIHDSGSRYRKALQKFTLDKNISQRNRELVISFLNDCELGKTLKKRQKKKIGIRRLNKLLYHLQIYARTVKMDFDKVQMKNIENFIIKLENDTLSFIDENRKRVHLKYAPATKKDTKNVIRKFYKWFYGNSEREPELVSWFDTSLPETEPDAIDEKQVEQIVSFLTLIRDKALVWSLYESGVRSEEFLNIRLHHVTNKQNYFTFRIEYPKTFKRTTPIYEEPFRTHGISYIQKWLSIHPEKNNPHAQLFPIGYRRIVKIIKQAGFAALNKNVTPHMLRHSRATYLAQKKVGRYQMCKLMGWSMSSRMPDRYINRAGVVEEEAIEAIRRDDLAKTEQDNLELKRKIVELKLQQEKMKEFSSARQKSDSVMNQLFSDSEFQVVLKRKIKELGLVKEILEV